MSSDRDSAKADYVPSLSSQQIERVKTWHEAAYRVAVEEAGQDGRSFSYLGLDLHVPPQVQPITPLSHLLGEAVIKEVRPGERVLDMGTGCGVNAILAARAGAHVIAVDLNPEAVRAARANAERNGVMDRVEVREGDVFDPVDPASDERFDLVVFDPPFRWLEPRDLLEMATADPSYEALTRFVREVRSYLSDRGRVLLFFGTSGDLGYLQSLIDAEGFTVAELAREALVKDDFKVEYITHRLTP